MKRQKRTRPLRRGENGALYSSEYRYRDHAGGVTNPSVERLHHLKKVGDLVRVRGIAWINKHGHSQWAVIVRGTQGYARYEGFCWGYGGTGPHGLRRLFDFYRIPKTLAAHIAHDIPSPSLKPMTFWKLEASDDNERYDFYRYDENEPKRVVEHLKVTTQVEIISHRVDKQLRLFTV